ncbi:MAG: hypothetical protein JWN44_2608 [Myxococcales bacterium]|nr:hypothetical protein [Myxococcales bacterium]
MMRFLVAVLVIAGCTEPRWSVPLPALDRVPLSVAERASDDVWAAGGALSSGGGGLLVHYDGKAWTALETGSDATLWWVHVLSATSVWSVGERGTIVHWSGALEMQSQPALTTATLYGVWGTSDDDLWVVGGDPDRSGVILRRDASGWRDVTPVGTKSAFFKVWGSRSDDVYVCGQEGALWHWDGSALAAIDTGLGRSTPLLTVAGRSASDVYAVGGLGNGVVLHFDGGSWQRLTGAPFDEAPGLAGVAVNAEGSAIVVGGGGTKLRRGAAGGAWTDETTQATRVDLHAASFVGAEIFAVGGNYQAPAPAVRVGVVAHWGTREVAGVVR